MSTKFTYVYINILPGIHSLRTWLVATVVLTATVKGFAISTFSKAEATGITVESFKLCEVGETVDDDLKSWGLFGKDT